MTHAEWSIDVTFSHAIDSPEENGHEQNQFELVKS
jgi:hypothetical protein